MQFTKAQRKFVLAIVLIVAFVALAVAGTIEGESALFALGGIAA